MVQNWFEISCENLNKFNHVSLDNDLTLLVKQTSQLSSIEMDQIQSLLETAYTTHSMWDYFYESYREDPRTFTFMILNEMGDVIATRTIGEVAWGHKYWNKEARIVNQDNPIVGSSFVVDWNYRGQKIGLTLLKETNKWVANHSTVNIVFGDTVSRKALELYLKNGARLNKNSIDTLCKEYDSQSFDDFFLKTKKLERLPDHLGGLYVWVFDETSYELLKPFGY